jgi:hypothetical protein
VTYGLGDLGLVVALAALDPLDQARRVGLQEDDEIGLGACGSSIA